MQQFYVKRCIDINNIECCNMIISLSLPSCQGQKTNSNAEKSLGIRSEKCNSHENLLFDKTLFIVLFEFRIEFYTHKEVIDSLL